VRESGVDGRKKAVKSVYVTAKTSSLSWFERCVCHVAAICAPQVEAHKDGCSTATSGAESYET